jgi:hypothetical protein
VPLPDLAGLSAQPAFYKLEALGIKDINWESTASFPDGSGEVWWWPSVWLRQRRRRVLAVRPRWASL